MWVTDIQAADKKSVWNSASLDGLHSAGPYPGCLSPPESAVPTSQCFSLRRPHGSNDRCFAEGSAQRLPGRSRDTVGQCLWAEL